MKLQEAALPVAVVAALLYIYAQFVLAFLAAGFVTIAAGFVTFVFVLQLAKTAAIFAIGSLRRAKGPLLLDIYGAELLLLPAFLLAYVFFQVPEVRTLVNEMMQGWVLGVVFGAFPLLAYRVGAGIFRGARMADVIPTGMVSAELGILLSNGAASAAQAHKGLGGILDFALTGKGSFSATTPWTFVATAALYVALLLYALAGRNVFPPVDLTKALVLGGGATLLAAAWVAVLSHSSLAMDIIFTPPTLGAAAVTWWIARGK